MRTGLALDGDVGFSVISEKCPSNKLFKGGFLLALVPSNYMYFYFFLIFFSNYVTHQFAIEENKVSVMSL